MTPFVRNQTRPADHRPIFGWLIAITVASSVFNDFPALLPAGEMSRDPFVALFPILFATVFFRPGTVRIPVVFSLFVLALVVVVVAGVAVNYEDIAAAYLKGRSGVGRVASQGMILAFGVAVSLIAYNVTTRNGARSITMGARWGLIAMAAVGALELASWFDVPGPTQIYAALSRLIHFETYEFYPTRLRSTAFEVSWTAVFLTFVFPLAVLGVSGWRRTALLVVVVAMVALAQSRTAMLVVGLQLVTLYVMMSRHRADRLVHGAAAAAIALTMVFLIPGAARDVTAALSNLVEYGSLDGPYERAASDENVSNLTRLSHIRIGMEMYAAQPVLGVGLGQYGFHYPDFVRAEDLRSWEVRTYLLGDALHTDWPPSYSIHVRMLAELGSIGYGVWLAMIVLPMAGCLWRSDARTEAGRLRLAVAIVLLGWLLLAFSIDSLRFFGGWIALGMAYALLDLRSAEEPRARPGPA